MELKKTESDIFKNTLPVVFLLSILKVAIGFSMPNLKKSNLIFVIKNF